MRIYKDFQTIEWSKGTSTELFIYPENSSIKDRSFTIRISKATILEDSTFTKFEGYWRKFTLLEGRIQLEHQNQHTTTVLPFESDEFSGNWMTLSKGKGTAFNVIAKKEIQFRSTILQIERTLQIDGNQTKNLIYVLDNSIEINRNHIPKGCLVEINHEQIHVKSSAMSKIICIQFRENN